MGEALEGDCTPNLLTFLYNCDGSQVSSTSESTTMISGLVRQSAKSMVRLATMSVLSEYSSSDVGQYSAGKLRVS